MDTEKNINPNQRLVSRVAQVDGLGRTIAHGQNAKLVLEICDPILEERLGVLLDQFRQCPPELGPILDFRAKISEAWLLRKKIKEAAQKGVSAEEALQAMFEQLGQKQKNGAQKQAEVKEV